MADRGEDWLGSQRDAVQGATTERYDVFLAYNSRDEDAKRCLQTIAKALEEKGQQRAWTDLEDAVPGVPSAPQLIDGLRRSNTCAMLYGAHGLGRWQGGLELDQTMERYNDRSGFRVFAVHLPGSAGNEELPGELKPYTSVDLREAFDEHGNLTEDGFQRMYGAVRGRSPRQMRKAPITPAVRVHTGPHRALLVNVSSYTDPGLKTLHGPRNDVEQLGKALTQVGAPGEGWRIQRKLADPTKDQLSSALEAFLVDDASAEDTLLFYFSGHGLAGAGESYLCLTDTKAQMPSNSGYSATSVVELLKASPAAEKIVILDCCHGASIRESVFSTLTTEHNTAVITAQGPQLDGRRVAEMSEFTKSLVRTLRDEGAYEQDRLTVSRLIDRLTQEGRKLWTNELGSQVVLATAAPAGKAPVIESKADVSVTLTPDSVCEGRRDRLELLRQLAITIEGLQAVAPDAAQIPGRVLPDSIDVLAGELRALLPDETIGQLRSQQKDRVSVELRFGAERDRELRDLPWEFLSLNGGDSKPLSVERIVELERGTKGPNGGEVDRIGWFSSMRRDSPTKHYLLTDVTQGKVDFNPIHPVTWKTFLEAPETDELVVFHVPVVLEDQAPKVLFKGEQEGNWYAVTAEKLAYALDDKWPGLTWLVIETVADRCSQMPAHAVRLLAEVLARESKRPVVAVCHPYAYLRSLDEDAYPPVFLAELLKQRRQSMPLEHAVYLAREAVDKYRPGAVGVPVIVRPQPRESSSPPGVSEQRAGATPSLTA